MRVQYPKPGEVLAAEQEERAERHRMATRAPEPGGGLPSDIPPDCKQQ